MYLKKRGCRLLTGMGALGGGKADELMTGLVGVKYMKYLSSSWSHTFVKYIFLFFICHNLAMDSILGFEHSAHHGRWHALRLTDIQQWLSRLGNIWTCERYQHEQTRVWQDYQRWQDMDISYEGEAVGLNMMIDIWMYNSRRWVFKASGLVWEESEEGKNAQKGRGKGSLSATTWKKRDWLFPQVTSCTSLQL